MKTMLNKFGFPPGAWRGAKEEVREMLIAKARTHSFITYSEPAPKISSITVEYYDLRLNALLGEVVAGNPQVASQEWVNPLR